MDKKASIDKAVARLHSVLRYKHMALKTEKTYTYWVKRFCWWLFDHPAGSHEEKLRGFLTELAERRNRCLWP